MAMKAIVKSVNSGDTLVLRGQPGPQGQPPKERTLHLADVAAPKMGNPSRDDEPWAFESRDFLRALAVGKPVSFTSTHNLASDDGSMRDFGTVEIAGVDVTDELLRNGWVKLKESKREPTEEELRRRELEAEAKAAGKGIWNPHGPQARIIRHTMPADSAAFVSQWKALVEHVRDGSTLRVRLFMPDGEHQMANIALTGVRCPKTAPKSGEPSEQFAEEAKFFTESRLLQRPVSVFILSLPTPTATPFQSSANNVPPPTTSIFIGTVLHPSGNIAEYLVKAGLARVVDWHAGLLAASGGMERLRAAEKYAKDNGAGLYAHTAPSPAPATSGVKGILKSFEATVVRVWSGDQISVVEKDSGKEHRLQLSSTRGPKMADPKQAFYAQEAREFLRKKLIGRNVRVTVDFIRPREGEFEERECATVRYGGQNANIAEQLIERGFASVVRHRRDDESRAPDYDKLMVAEQAAMTEERGIHSGKDHPPPKPPVNISEIPSRANSFLNGFKRQGKIPVVVELFLPKDNQTLILVFSGIRAPRTARNPSEKSEPWGVEAAEFSTRKYMQRDAEVEIEAVDKSGGFIGALWVKGENVAVTLVREGLASVQGLSVDSLSWSRQLLDAEAEAKKARRNLWQDYDVEKAAQAASMGETMAPLKPEYIDIIISDVRTKNGLNFSVQILNTEGIASLEKLMREFSIYHKSASAPSDFTPSNGDLVSARFSDGSWYRARIRRSSPIKKEAEVTFIDYGNQSTVKYENLRPLDPKFRPLPGQAQDARLSFVQFPKPESEYYLDAVDRFRTLCEGRKLVALIDHKEGNLLHMRLIDPTESNAANDPCACINADLLREGLVSIDRKDCHYLSSYPQLAKKLQKAVSCAKQDRLGMFEFGDIEEDE
ncbi:hypothetical protein ID866_516 [Astraeus odoratus]|nr:hypothetical protein ID866_516 [Astraeus odoratus]